MLLILYAVEKYNGRMASFNNSVVKNKSLLKLWRSVFASSGAQTSFCLSVKSDQACLNRWGKLRIVMVLILLPQLKLSDVKRPADKVKNVWLLLNEKLIFENFKSTY